MSKQKTAVEVIMSELLWCGGEQKSRKQIHDELLAEGFEQRYIDFYIFCLAQQKAKKNT